MGKDALVRLGLFILALAAIILGLNLMNIRNDFALLAGAVAAIGGFALAIALTWKFFKEIVK